MVVEAAMNTTKLILRYILFLTGLFLMGLGISLTTKSGLGTTPISSLPLVLSRIFPLSFGQLAFLLSLAFVLTELILLGRKFSKEQYLQILVGPFFGLFIDLGMMIFKGLSPSTYPGRLLVLLIGCVVLAMGVYLQVAARVVINPGEGVVKVIADLTGRRFGNIKILFDTGLFLIALVISLAVFGDMESMREGTLIVALATGTITKIYKAIFDRLGVDGLYR